jgi:hypothetical protein
MLIQQVKAYEVRVAATRRREAVLALVTALALERWSRQEISWIQARARVFIISSPDTAEQQQLVDCY